MKTLLFVWYLMNGTLIPQKEIDGDWTYRIVFSTPDECFGKEVDYAYKEEVMEWIETGTFEYNEDLTFNK
jgi:hypothetical protein